MKFLLVCSQKWGKTDLLNSQHRLQAADEPGRLVPASGLPIPRPDPATIPGPILSMGCIQVWASGCPRFWGLGEFHFAALAAVFWSCHGSRGPGGLV